MRIMRPTIVYNIPGNLKLSDIQSAVDGMKEDLGEAQRTMARLLGKRWYE